MFESKMENNLNNKFLFSLLFKPLKILYFSLLLSLNFNLLKCEWIRFGA